MQPNQRRFSECMPARRIELCRSLQPKISVRRALHEAFQCRMTGRARCRRDIRSSVRGPAPYRWPLVSNLLIDHNTLLGLGDHPSSACKTDMPHQRTGISLGDGSLASGTVLYANTCPGARRPLDADMHHVITVCPPGVAPSCECERPLREGQ